MWPAFPASDYYESSVPSRQHQPTTGLPIHRPKDQWVRGHQNGSHVYRMTVRPGRRPSYAPAASPRLRRRHSSWPPDRRHQPAQGVPRPHHRVRTAARPTSAKLEPVDSIERLSNAGFSRTPSELACRTRAVWQYRPVPSLSGLLSTLTGASRIRLPPACAHLLRQAGRGVLSPPHGHTAPRGARCRSSTVGWVL